MRGDIFASENIATYPTQPGMSLQGRHSIKYAVNGEVLARQGAMVAYRGNLKFEVKSQGVGRFIQRAVTGEGLPLMSVQGQGEVWFADLAKNCFIISLDPGDQLSINAKHVLCFDTSLQYDIQMVQGAGIVGGGGLFNSVFSGQGNLGIVCDGAPIAIPVEPNAPVFVDRDAIVGWSANLQTSIVKSQSVRSMIRGGSGEVFQLALNGQGIALVQPSEGPKFPGS